jgi:predicted Zn-dependent protease
MRVKIVTVGTPSTLGQLAQQAGSRLPLETLAIINQTAANASFNTGDRVKMVIGELLVTE